MTLLQAHHLLALLGPLDWTRPCVVVDHGRIIVMLGGVPAVEEFDIACGLRDLLRSGLLIVR